MSRFSDEELMYLDEEAHLGRLATVGEDGVPHVVPVGWRYDAENDAIEIGGRDAAEFVRTRKFRNVRIKGTAALVVDDVLPPWRPRAVLVRGRAEAIHDRTTDGTASAFIRIAPTEVISWGVTERE